MQTAKVALPVFFLSLGGCGALTIEQELRGLDGVVEVYVNPMTETAYLTYDPARLPVRAIVEVIRALGYATREPATQPAAENANRRVSGRR